MWLNTENGLLPGILLRREHLTKSPENWKAIKSSRTKVGLMVQEFQQWEFREGDHKKTIKWIQNQDTIRLLLSFLLPLKSKLPSQGKREAFLNPQVQGSTSKDLKIITTTAYQINVNYFHMDPDSLSLKALLCLLLVQFCFRKDETNHQSHKG